MTTIIIVVCVILILITIISFNNLLSKKNSVENAISTIDTYLQTRLDLMSNLFEQVSISINHETDLYKEVVKLRNQQEHIQEEYKHNNNKNLVELDNKISNLIKELKIVHENYPEIKSIEAVTKAMDANIEVENQINAARRNYNNNVNDYKNSIKSFPNIIFAGLFGFKNNYELFKAEENAKNRISPNDFIK